MICIKIKVNIQGLKKITQTQIFKKCLTKMKRKHDNRTVMSTMNTKI